MSEGENNISYRLKRVEERVQDLEDKNSATHQKFFDKLEIIDRKVAVTEDRYATILNVLGEVKTDIATLKEKPTKRWETVVAAIISAVVGVVVGLALTGKF